MAQSASTTKSNPADVHAAVADETIGHGNSPAAWTTVLIMLIGAAVSSFAFIFASTEGNLDSGTVLFWIGVILMLVGLIVGWVMRRAGYGVGGHRVKNSGH